MTKDSNWESDISFIFSSCAFKYLDDDVSLSLKTTRVVFLLILVVTLPPLFSIIFCHSEFLKPVKTTIWSLKLCFLPVDWAVLAFEWDNNDADVNGVDSEEYVTKVGVREGDIDEDEDVERGAKVI